MHRQDGAHPRMFHVPIQKGGKPPIRAEFLSQQRGNGDREIVEGSSIREYKRVIFKVQFLRVAASNCSPTHDWKKLIAIEKRENVSFESQKILPMVKNCGKSRSAAANRPTVKSLPFPIGRFWPPINIEFRTWFVETMLVIVIEEGFQ